MVSGRDATVGESNGVGAKTDGGGPDRSGFFRSGRAPFLWGVEIALRVVLGALFIYSGAMKLLDPAAFQVEIANFELIPLGLSGLVALYLPWLELLCGVALVVKRHAGGSLLILGVLMVMFIAFVGSAWARGLDVTCGCFGASDSAPNYPLWIGRNLLILSGLVATAWIGRRLTPGK